MLDIALVAKLGSVTAVTQLVGDRVYPDWVRMADKVYPLIVFKIEGVDANRAFDGPTGLETAKVMIACIGQTYDDAAKVADAVQVALDAQKGTWGGVVVQGTFLQDDGINDDVITDQHTEAITAYVKNLTFDAAYVRS